MSRSVVRRPAAGKAQPSLQQQLASGKRVKAARQAQQAQGKRKAPDTALPIPEAAPVGASVAGASHVSASRLLALLQPPAVPAAQTRPPASSAVVHTEPAFRGREDIEPGPLPLYASSFAAPTTAAVAVSSIISDNRRRQMGSSIFNNDTPAPHHHPPLTATSRTASHLSLPPPPPQPLSTHHPSSPPTEPAAAAASAVYGQSVATSPTARQSWGGGGRSLEAGDSARGAEWQKKLEMRASLDAQMREKEEKKRQERLQAQSNNSRVQEHWLDAPTAPQSLYTQPTSTTAPHPAAVSHQPLTLSMAITQPYTADQSTSRTLSSPAAAPSHPQPSASMSSIRSHNQSSSVFTTAGNDTTEQRKAHIRQEVQAALRQQMDDKKRRDEEKKKAEAEDEKRWEEKLERERRELANRYVNGPAGLVVEEERKEAVVAAVGVGGGVRSVSDVGVVHEEKQQLTVREDRKAVDRRRAHSEDESESDHEHDDRRRRRARDRRASRERGRRSRRRHSDSDDSASSYSDGSDRHSRRRRSSRQRSGRRERRSRYSSQSDEDERVESIYVADSAYTHRLRYEQEHKEMEKLASSTSTSRRSSINSHKSKPSTSSSNRPSSSSSASLLSAPAAKPPFGVRSLQSKAQPKPPASRVRPPPPPLPMGDTKASKQALSAARLAVGRTSGGGDKFVTQKWKEKRTAKQIAAEQGPSKAVGGNRDTKEVERTVVTSGSGGVVDDIVANVQELSLVDRLADRLDSTSEWLLPHSLGLPSYRG